MIKRMLFLVALCAVVLLTACLDSLTVISVRKDGSGTLTETVFVSSSMKMMMEGMMSGMTDEEETEHAGELLDTEKYKEKAAKLGPGVRFVSAEEVTSEDGSEGVRVVYAFDDIRTLNYEAEPENPMGDQMAAGMGAEPSEDEDEDPFTFDFVPGRTPKLIVHIPQDDEPEPVEEVQEDEADTEAAFDGMAMMKGFLADFRMRVMIELLEGKIQKTNASFVERVDGKETVTLLDIALGDIMNNEEYYKEWQSMSRMQDMTAAMEMMSKIPGLKIETNKRVEISFR